MVLQNNVDNKTFGNAIENMENTIQEPNRAFLSYKEYVLNDEEHKCKVKFLNRKKIVYQKKYLCFFKQFELVWTSPTPFFGCSVAMKKKSPYFKLLKMEFADLIDYGSLDRLNMKHSNSLTNCKTNDMGGNSLGYFKVATLFYILGIGIILSVFTFLYELFHKPLIISNNDRAKIYEKQTSSTHVDNEMEIFDDIFNIDFQKQCDEALNMLLNLQNEHGDLFKEFQNRRLDDLTELVLGDM